MGYLLYYKNLNQLDDVTEKKREESLYERLKGIDSIHLFLETIEGTPIDCCIYKKYTRNIDPNETKMSYTPSLRVFQVVLFYLNCKIKGGLLGEYKY